MTTLPPPINARPQSVQSPGASGLPPTTNAHPENTPEPVASSASSTATVETETDRLLREWHEQLAVAEAKQVQERPEVLQARIDQARDEEPESPPVSQEPAAVATFVPGEVQVAPPASEFFVIPLRFVLLHSASYPGLSASPDLAQESPRVVDKMNRILAAAGVSLDFQGASVEDADDANLTAHLGWSSADRPRLRQVQFAIPAADAGQPGFRIFFVHDVAGATGVYLGRGNASVRDGMGGRRRRGGVFDFPLPRVCAHEIGHGLGLGHASPHTRLMDHGGMHLTAEEIARVRATARTFPGSWAVGDAAPPPAVAAVAGRPLDSALGGSELDRRSGPRDADEAIPRLDP